MIREDFWDLTNRPHTKTKLQILSQYLPAWADIILAQWRIHPNWKAYRTPYYVDCFSGRGKFHDKGVNDCIDGSPIIGLETFLAKQEEYADKFSLEIKPKCIFVEYKKSFAKELKEFIEPYRGRVDFELYEATDVNTVIHEIVEKTGYSPTFFFVDPGGIKELKKETIHALASKKGGRDIMLNYIADGPRRVGGLAKSIMTGKFQGIPAPQHFKTIKRLEDFAGSQALDNLDASEKDQLRNWVNEILEASNTASDSRNQLETIFYDMKHPGKNQNIYYLLFASRKNAAKNIMKTIFKEAKQTDYTGQTSFDFDQDEEFEL